MPTIKELMYHDADMQFNEHIYMDVQTNWVTLPTYPHPTVLPLMVKSWHRFSSTSE
jgi:hypothetical protein